MIDVRRRTCAVLGALALAGAPAHARAVEEARWIAAATTAVAFGQQQGLPIVLRVEQGDALPGHTPLGIQSEPGYCTLVVSARANPTAERMAALVRPELLDLFLTGAAVHEVGHCYRRLHGYPHNERLLPLAARFSFVRRWFDRRVRTEEAFADMTEAAWLARFHPDQFGPMMDAIAQVRTRFLEPRHDTRAWLDQARRQGTAGAGADVFAQAGALLARVE